MSVLKKDENMSKSASSNKSKDNIKSTGLMEW